MSSSWHQDWLSIQRQWFESLAPGDNYHSLDEIAGESVSQWQRGLEQLFSSSNSLDSLLAKNIKPPAAELNNSWCEQIAKFVEILPAISGDGSAEYDWRTAFENYIKEAKQQIRTSESLSAYKFWPGLATLPFEQFLNNANYPNKENIRKTYLSWQEYLNHYQAYQAYLKNIDLECLDILHKKVLELAVNEESISSMRELYNLWVDCYEEAYEVIISSEDYSRLFAAMINSLLQFRLDVNALLLQSISLNNNTNLETAESLAREVKDIRKQHTLDQQRIKKLEEKLKKLTEQNANE